MMPPDLVLVEADFLRIQALMQQASGIHLSLAKRSLVANRLQNRVRELGLDSYRTYLERVASDAAERQRLVDVLTTNETRFFREPRHFELLGRLAASGPDRLRVWSAACSTGQEAFTIAMTLAETLRHQRWEILASDLSRSVLRTAETAIYPERLGQDIPPALLHRYCLRGVADMASHFRIGPALRERVRFSAINLVEPLPASLGQFDVIFLRNVLIYFDTATKTRILNQVLAQLRPGGTLFVGHSESLHGLGLAVTNLAPAVYRKATAMQPGTRRAS